ncbi:MAG: endo-1,3-alpha-glucanase family glycosylhydrolase [Geodermatophilaceae bacterium]
MGRAPLRDTDYRLADMRTEVRQAKAAGIDGFTVNIMSLHGRNWTACVNLMKAADDIGGFAIVPNLDVSADMAGRAPDTIATSLAQLYAYPSAEQVDGGYMLSSFDAEARSPEWWTRVTTPLARHGYRTKFIAVLLNPSDANFTAFAPIVYGYGWWGARTPVSVDHQRNLAQKAHEMGRKWMEPVAFQDTRPQARQYAEAGNSELLRRSWGRAISQHADYVQMVTWNDYSESTSFAPSMAHGRTLLDANRLYLEWYKSDVKPAITTDHIFLTHRTHPYAARTTSGIVVMKPTLDGSAMAPRDTVEALVYLTAPAQVSITDGGVTRTYSRPAGISAVTVPLGAGSVSAKVIRGSRTVDTAVSPRHVITRRTFKTCSTGQRGIENYPFVAP